MLQKNRHYLLPGGFFCYFFLLGERRGAQGEELLYSLFADEFLCQHPQTFVQAQLRDNTRAGESQVEDRRRD